VLFGLIIGLRFGVLIGGVIEARKDKNKGK
jgi:hypothetical protein